MIYTGPSLVAKNGIRVLTTLNHSLRHATGFPTPASLRALTRPTRTAPLTLRITAHPFLTYRALSSVGTPGGSTLIGTALLRPTVRRDFSSTSKPGVTEPHQSLGKPEVQPEASVTSGPKTTGPEPVLIAMSSLNYRLDKIGDQYILEVCYGRFGISILNIPLNAKETAIALSGKEALNNLADHIRLNIPFFKLRHSPIKSGASTQEKSISDVTVRTEKSTPSEPKISEQERTLVEEAGCPYSLYSINDEYVLVVLGAGLRIIILPLDLPQHQSILTNRESREQMVKALLNASRRHGSRSVQPASPMIQKQTSSPSEPHIPQHVQPASPVMQKQTSSPSEPHIPQHVQPDPVILKPTYSPSEPNVLRYFRPGYPVTQLRKKLIANSSWPYSMYKINDQYVLSILRPTKSELAGTELPMEVLEIMLPCSINSTRLPMLNIPLNSDETHMLFTMHRPVGELVDIVVQNLVVYTERHIDLD